MLSMSVFFKEEINSSRQSLGVQTCLKHLLVNSLSIFLLLVVVAVPTMTDIFYLTGETSAFYSIY